MGPPLWVVKRGDARVFLLGDSPGAPNDRWVTDDIRHAVAASDEVWSEVPGDEDVGSNQLMTQLGLSDSPLADRLGPARHGRVVAVGNRLGVAPKQLEGLRPWLAAQLLDAALLAAAGLDPSTRVDRTVTRLARESGARLRWELDVDEAIRLFGDLSGDAEVAYLDMVLARADDGPLGLERSFHAWNEGDVSATETLAGQLRRRSRDLDDDLIGNRNAAWLLRIDEMLDRPGTRFVVVGLLHLVGAGGIPTLLDEHGTPTRRV